MRSIAADSQILRDRINGRKKEMRRIEIVLILPENEEQNLDEVVKSEVGQHYPLYRWTSQPASEKESRWYEWYTTEYMEEQ